MLDGWSHPKPTRKGCPTTPNTGDAREEANSSNCNTVLTCRTRNNGS